MQILAYVCNVFGITPALADAAAQPNAQQGLLSMLPFFGILILFTYFMVIRPQAKRAKAQKALLNELKVGAEVILGGGIVGKIEKIAKDFVMVEVADKTVITVQKNAVVGFIPKGTLKSVKDE